MPRRTSNEIWNRAAAQSYDSPGEGMFDEQVLDRTTARLQELADGGPALEFAVGTGRVAIPLQRRGVSVSGIEWSPDMVDRLREKVDEATLPVTLGDMSTTRVDGAGEFGLVYLVYNTIANLLTQEGQVECFRNAARHLRPGGRFVIELWVPRPQSTHGAVAAEVFTVEDGYLGVDVMDPVTQQLVSHHVRFDDDGTATVGFSPHRYVWPSELDLMARLAGLELETRHADWEGTPFSHDSRGHVSVYRKP
ncbi:class I SAM-dependent methyltransferase [Aestuariimicrobium sp. T2.26MG-19.2B]|uniref:class I SAM-dependent methyltransferase n=1 Tax=Aestuariimicrobium sp. T2.26MG-19.2B TaxID=3040679 RepID=UPI00247741B7|nr:class I SAM-dependent methyltransferase [Aestuariimicrobium sp. T2.26MG-19.2B]CAI9399205.1 Cypemycin N-terminal methyltransferase [Aestuariimicrobium sp. T2.26MG-19.2B]